MGRLVRLFGGMLALGAAAFAFPTFAQDIDGDWFDQRIERILAAAGVPGAAIVVERGGREVHAAGYGWADREASTPATADTPFAVASVTKPMTAVAVLMLVGDGELALDAPANRYLPATAPLRLLDGELAQTTLRELLSHRSGLGTYYRFYTAARTMPDIDTEMASLGVIDPAQRGEYEYSNWGYAVLQRVIERVSGMSYADFLETRLFAPLGMDTAYVVTRAGWGEAAVPYNRAGPLPEYATVHAAASGAIMSMRDLARFGRFLLDARQGKSALLSMELARAMSGDTDDCSATAVMELGIERRPGEGRCALYHSGKMPGVSARLYLLPSEDMVIVDAANLMEGETSAMLSEALQAFTSPPASKLIGLWTGASRGVPVRLQLDGATQLLSVGEHEFDVRVEPNGNGVTINGRRPLRHGRIETIEGTLRKNSEEILRGFLVRISEGFEIDVNYGESLSIELAAAD